MLNQKILTICTLEKQVSGTRKKNIKKKTVITDEDVNFPEGKESEMIERLGYKLEKTREELVYIISTME